MARIRQIFADQISENSPDPRHPYVPLVERFLSRLNSYGRTIISRQSRSGRAGRASTPVTSFGSDWITCLRLDDAVTQRDKGVDHFGVGSADLGKRLEAARWRLHLVFQV